MISKKTVYFYIFLLNITTFFQSSSAQDDVIFGSAESMESVMQIDQYNDVSNDSRGIDIFDDQNSFEAAMEDLDIEDFINTVDTAATPRKIEVKSILELLDEVGAFSVLDQDFYK